MRLGSCLISVSGSVGTPCRCLGTGRIMFLGGMVLALRRFLQTPVISSEAEDGIVENRLKSIMEK